MTAFEERPHSPYFGSADATPLFLVLLHEYLLWTNDEATVADEALARIAGEYTREAGVRQLERALAKILRKVAVTLATDPVQVATYSPTLAPLSWLPYNASAAQFSVRSNVAGTPIQSQPVDLRAASARVDFSY